MFALIFRDHDGYHEFNYQVKIPLRLLKNQNPDVCKYKYHIESPATHNKLIKSLEFIVGPKTSGGIIDRFLAVHHELKPECKELLCMCICILAIIIPLEINVQ